MANWFINIHWYFRHGHKKETFYWPGNRAFNIRASLRKESWGEAPVAKSFPSNSKVWKHVHRSHSNRSTTVAGEEKYDGWACVCLELRVTFPGTCLWWGTWDGARASRRHEHGWSLSRRAGLAAQPTPEPGLHITALSILMLPAVFYDSGEGPPDEGINYALGTINYLWLPC